MVGQSVGVEGKEEEEMGCRRGGYSGIVGGLAGGPGGFEMEGAEVSSCIISWYTSAKRLDQHHREWVECVEGGSLIWRPVLPVEPNLVVNPEVADRG